MSIFFTCLQYVQASIWYSTVCPFLPSLLYGQYLHWWSTVCPGPPLFPFGMSILRHPAVVLHYVLQYVLHCVLQYVHPPPSSSMFILRHLLLGLSVCPSVPLDGSTASKLPPTCILNDAKNFGWNGKELACSSKGGGRLRCCTLKLETH